jgi:hypothetical protein
LQFICEDSTRFVVRSEIPALYDQRGHMIQPKQRRLYAQFVRGYAPIYGIELAKKIYGFKKKPDEIGVERWVACYDSVQAQDG